MTPVTKRKDTPHPVAFRLPDIARDQLDELMNRWGENQSQAIIRCIERIWVMEKNQMPMPAPRVNPYGNTVFSQELEEINALSNMQLASLLSIDRNIEVALYPAGIEVRVTERMKEELEAAIEYEKESTWLPIWKQLKGFIMSNVSSLVLKFTRFGAISLENLESIQMSEGRLQILNHQQSNIFGETRLYGKVGKYAIDLRPGEPDVFDVDDVHIFAKRVEEVKPFYISYLKAIGALPVEF